PEARDTVYQYFDGGIIKFALPVPVAMILAGLAAAFFAFLIGLPVLRLKSDYLAIATLGFAEIIRAIFQWDKLGPITNGSNLLRKFPGFTSVLFPFAVSGICITLIVLLINSSYGRAFKAIRDDEIAAEAMGINLAKHKQLAFTISSFFAGVGGALLAMYQTTVQASAFTSAMTYEILLIVVIGGIGSVTGSILSSFLFIACSEWWLRFLDNETYIGSFRVPLLSSGFRKVVFSIIIMVVVLFYRQGIMGTKELSADAITRFFRKLRGKTKEEAAK
ncbi:MAG TPA: branched-chain amino acid ABC transporter permease, partial [Clostridiaceae bacterium]|nr:branched-chain amino acid ABC transporter permease [Clostridiaceae bacterium]